MTKKMKDWFELIRLPNLFTLPGDVLVGMAAVLTFTDFKTQWTHFLLLCLISALLYSGGLILNDFMDYEEDCAERPDRVLPSGRISRTDALVGLEGLLRLIWRMDWQGNRPI